MKLFRLLGYCCIIALFASAALARVTNLTTAVGYDAIQAALDDASANDIIEAYEGTYNEVLTNDVSGVVLRAHAGDQVVVSPTSTETAILMQANDTVVQGFEITGSGIMIGIQMKCSDRMKAIDNYIHDISPTNVST